MKKKHYKIGTRGSLLALTQTEMVRDQLVELTGDQFDIIPIKTQGDINTTTPLWQLEGENFFTKELDSALLNKEVDFVVHSYKDLGTKRPQGTMLAALTKRNFSHDILLIKKNTVSILHKIDLLEIGTSSPRRIANIEKKLNKFLPKNPNRKITTKTLRGNIITRIKKLLDDDYHAIVLALAGLERLACKEGPKQELQELLESLDFMVLPQSKFPSAAGQGTLALECLRNRNDHDELLNKLKLLNDDKTYREVEKERKAFSAYGGGCHLPIGIQVDQIEDLYLHIHQGVLDKQKVKKIHLERKEIIEFPGGNVFIGLPPREKKKANELFIIYDEIIEKKLINDFPEQSNPSHFFITSKYCLHAVKKLFKKGHIWASGTRTMEKLADEGHWVNGTSDSRGENEIIKLLSSKALSLMMERNISNDWCVLSNGQSESQLGKVTATYKRVARPPTPQYRNEIIDTQTFYWTSYFQYKTFIEIFPEIKTAIHCCGIGKTWERFKDEGIKVIPFSGMYEFKNWIQLNQDDNYE